MSSIALALAFLPLPIGDVADASPRVELSMYVDDGGQYADGPDERKVAKLLAKAAVAFVRNADDLGLSLSVNDPLTGKEGNSTFVFNSRAVSAMVQTHQAYAWVHIQIKAIARNIAVLTAAGSIRRVALQKKLMQSGGQRFQRIM